MHWPSIILYVISSIFIIMANKIILTIFVFPSVMFIMWAQSIFTIIVFSLSKRPVFNNNNLKTLLLTCVLNVANVFFGLSGSGLLNVAMFAALRRVNIATTMFAQSYFFSKPLVRNVVISVVIMLFGSIIAASNDLTFNIRGYSFVMVNNLLTTGAQISQKAALKDNWSKETIIFCTSLLTIVVSSFYIMNNVDLLYKFPFWPQPAFLLCLMGSITLGFIINWSCSWIIERNDALTLSVTGSSRSVILGLAVCLGLFDRSYIFTWPNFIGLQISGIGSLIYIHYSLKDDSMSKDVRQEVQIEHLEADVKEKAIICEEGNR